MLLNLEKDIKMIRFIKWLFTGDAHLHKWKIINEYKKVQADTQKTVGITYIMRCEHCGEIKDFESEV